MIYTVTLNPSLDYIMQVDDLIIGTTNRSSAERIHIGGKGINVSIVLNNLQTETTALGFIGGFSGQYLQEQLAQYPNIHESLLSYEGPTRINIKIKGEQETEINSKGALVSDVVQQQLTTFLQQVKPTDFVVLSGSLASGMPSNWYEVIAQQLKQKGVPYVLDIATNNVFDILPYQPLLVKPNQAELEALFKVSDLSLEELISKGQELIKLGAQHLIISRGGSGSLLLKDDEVYQAQVPSGKLIDSVGAGDSMVAGFVYGYQKFNDSLEAFRYASSCGTATAYSVHLAEQPLISEIYDQTIIERIK